MELVIVFAAGLFTGYISSWFHYRILALASKHALNRLDVLTQRQALYIDQVQTNINRNVRNTDMNNMNNMNNTNDAYYESWINDGKPRE